MVIPYLGSSIIEGHPLVGVIPCRWSFQVGVIPCLGSSIEGHAVADHPQDLEIGLVPLMLGAADMTFYQIIKLN